MLPKSYIDNFNEDKLRLYIPTFALDSSDGDKIWCTFMWMIGQNFGFDHPYWFNLGDYTTVVGGTRGIPEQTVCHYFTQRHGEHLAMGYHDGTEVFMEFRRTDWEFVSYDIESPLKQRIWIHLYSQVFNGKKLRGDLWDKSGKHSTPNGGRIFTDTAWWISTSTFNASIPRRVPQAETYVPHYLRDNNRIAWGEAKNGRPFAGKIKDTQHDIT